MEPPAAREPAPPPARSEPPPADLAPLDPRVRWVWWLTAAVVAVPLLAVLATAVAVAPVPGPTGALVAAAVVLTAVVAVVVPVVRYRRWRYALRERDLWIRKGVLWVTVSVIPYQRLQFVDTRQGPLDRLFGLSQLVVHTAALGTSGRLPGLDAAEAERLRDRLAAVEPDVAAV